MTLANDLSGVPSFVRLKRLLTYMQLVIIFTEQKAVVFIVSSRATIVYSAHWAFLVFDHNLLGNDGL